MHIFPRKKYAYAYFLPKSMHMHIFVFFDFWKIIKICICFSRNHNFRTLGFGKSMHLLVKSMHMHTFVCKKYTYAYIFPKCAVPEKLYPHMHYAYGFFWWFLRISKCILLSKTPIFRVTDIKNTSSKRILRAFQIPDF